MSENLFSPDPETSARLPRLKIIGVGGAGGNLAAALAAPGLAGVQCLALDASWSALQSRGGLATLLLGRSVLGGLSAGGDPKLGRSAAEADLETIRLAVADADVVFVMAGLGGGTGGGAAPVVAQAAKAAGALVLGVVAMPFDMEGSRRQRQALLGLARLRQEADVVIPLPNQRTISLAATQLTVPQLFAGANEQLAAAVRAVWRLVTLPGPVRLDLGAFRSAVAGKHAECLLVTAEASGDNRTFDVWGKLQQIPGFTHDSAMSDASHVVVGIAASEDLLTAEMEWLFAQVRQQFGQAQVLPGVSLDASLGGGLSVTLLLARHGERPVEHPAPPAPAAPSTPGHEWTENILPAANSGPRAPSRFVAPPPTVSPEKTRQIYRRQNPRGRRKTAGGEQVMLPLEVVSKGRFEKSDPTVRDGEDLDVPTYIRRGVLLN